MASTIYGPGRRGAFTAPGLGFVVVNDPAQAYTVGRNGQNWLTNDTAPAAPNTPFIPSTSVLLPIVALLQTVAFTVGPPPGNAPVVQTYTPAPTVVLAAVTAPVLQPASIRVAPLQSYPVFSVRVEAPGLPPLQTVRIATGGPLAVPVVPRVSVAPVQAPALQVASMLQTPTPGNPPATVTAFPSLVSSVVPVVVAPPPWTLISSSPTVGNQPDLRVSIRVRVLDPIGYPVQSVSILPGLPGPILPAGVLRIEPARTAPTPQVASITPGLLVVQVFVPTPPRTVVLEALRTPLALVQAIPGRTIGNLVVAGSGTRGRTFTYNQRVGMVRTYRQRVGRESNLDQLVGRVFVANKRIGRLQPYNQRPGRIGGQLS